MRKLVFHLFVFVIGLSTINAQYFDWEKMMAKYMNELAIGGGATNFMGELGGLDQIGTDFLFDFEWPASRWNVHVGYKHNFDKYWAFRTTLTVGELAGDDRWTNETFRRNRNLHFKTTLVELNAMLYFYFFRERPSHIYRLKKANGLNGRPFAMYAFGGVGAFWFNPKARFDGEWTKLRPLGTEGQMTPNGPKRYSNISFSLPVGIGISYMINLRWKLAIEASYHKTFTDYIDDVSTVYHNNDEILYYNGEAAAYLADPNIGTYNNTGEGLQRGDPTDLDAFFYCNFTIYHAFEKKKKKGYSPYRRRKRRASF